ncbi:MAG TPA: cytochrome o ubiquinol oxidase subunit III [Candidatus Paceibacterota bacterium]|nr:cytochrome o ubiquinol oxidase subunit III [Candidatus Paceibacterota bacterium]
MNPHHEHTQVQDRVGFGFWAYLMSDCVLFAALFAVFAVLRHATAGGPGMPDMTDLPFVLKETLVLLASTFAVGLAVLAVREGKKDLAIVMLAATLALGLAFLGMEAGEFRHLVAEGNGPSRSAFLSSFFTLVGTHGLHVALGAIWILVLMAHLLIKGVTAGTSRKLLCLSLFWHFLDIIWIFIFTFVYLFGALTL